MCGIWGSIGTAVPEDKAKSAILSLKARGPEASRIVQGARFQLGFTRLAINGLTDAGMQPMSFGSFQWVCNGEIYNHKDLEERYGIVTESGSDCEVLGELFSKVAPQTDAASFFRCLDGVFAFLCVDTASRSLWVGRDPYGVRPLYVGYGLGPIQETPEGNKRWVAVEGGVREVLQIQFASEMKALVHSCEFVEAFPPGHYAVYSLDTLERIGFEAYHTVPWLKNPALKNSQTLFESLQLAVEKRLMTERPVAALLSGGLDSSLVAALVQKNLKELGMPWNLKTYSIGFKGSEDLKYARIVADHIGSDHTEVILTPDDFFDAIPDVIQSIESFDITTVRASVGNWLVSKRIAEDGVCKVVFNGDGSDEVLGGYLYFYNAPSDEAFEYESGRLLKDIHLFDVLRSDRSISSHGLEARTPFLDKQFVAVARSLPTYQRRPALGETVEKACLRKSIPDGLLPASVVWRKKEAFSDGVSTSGEKSWYQICQEKASEALGSRESWPKSLQSLQHLPPKTAEAAYYRAVYQRFYGSKNDHVNVPYHWMPKWCPETLDPSARTLKLY